MPPSLLGLRHLALNVEHLEACTDFYMQLLGMRIIWQPDADNVYLTTGNDNLALHRAKCVIDRTVSPLDHFGFTLATPQLVDDWYYHLKSHQVILKSEPKNHRDGSRSFYCADPDSNIIQLIYLPEKLNLF